MVMISVTLSSTELSIDESDLLLNCTVFLQNFMATPSIEWEVPEDSRGGSMTVANPIFIHTSQVAFAYLELSPLHTSHGGEYRCVANVTVPQSISLMSSLTINVTVESELFYRVPLHCF